MGSAAGRLAGAPARTSLISCPASSCCRPRRAPTTARPARLPAAPMSASRLSKAGGRGPARRRSGRPTMRATRWRATAAAISTAAIGAGRTGWRNSPRSTDPRRCLPHQRLRRRAARLARLRRDGHQGLSRALSVDQPCALCRAAGAWFPLRRQRRVAGAGRAAHRRAACPLRAAADRRRAACQAGDRNGLQSLCPPLRRCRTPGRGSRVRSPRL